MLFWLSTSTVCEEEMPRFNARETAAPSCVHTGLVSDVNSPSPPALAGPTQPMPSVPALCGHYRTATGVHVSQQDLSLCTKYQHLLTTPCCGGSTRPDSKAPLKPGWRVPVPGSPAQLSPAPGQLRCGSGAAPVWLQHHPAPDAPHGPAGGPAEPPRGHPISPALPALVSSPRPRCGHQKRDGVRGEQWVTCSGSHPWVRAPRAVPPPLSGSAERWEPQLGTRGQKKSGFPPPRTGFGPGCPGCSRVPAVPAVPVSRGSPLSRGSRPGGAPQTPPPRRDGPLGRGQRGRPRTPGARR